MSHTFCIIARWAETIKVKVQREAKLKVRKIARAMTRGDDVHKFEIFRMG